MTSLEELNKYGYLADELVRTAYKSGWRIEKCGVETMFPRQVLEAIMRRFTPETLFLRAMPDFILESAEGFWFIEFKGPNFISPDRNGKARVRVEATQALYLCGHSTRFGLRILYLFMKEDMSGVVCPVQDLPVEELVLPDRFRREWDVVLQRWVRDWCRDFYPGHRVDVVPDPPTGSGDPFLAFDWEDLQKVGKDWQSWVRENGPHEKEDPGWNDTV